MARVRLDARSIAKNSPAQTANLRSRRKEQAIRVGFVGLTDCAPLISMEREFAASLVRANLISTAA